MGSVLNVAKLVCLPISQCFVYERHCESLVKGPQKPPEINLTVITTFTKFMVITVDAADMDRAEDWTKFTLTLRIELSLV